MDFSRFENFLNKLRDDGTKIEFGPMAGEDSLLSFACDWDELPEWRKEEISKAFDEALHEPS